MADVGQEGAVKRLVDLTRRITRVTQIAPFAYLLLLALYLISVSILPEWMIDVGGKIFTLPVYVIVCLLGLGRILKLCRWYITACLLPLLTKVVSYVDSFIITLWYEEVVLTDAVLGIGYLIYIYFAYRHFFHDGREKRTA